MNRDVDDISLLYEDVAPNNRDRDYALLVEERRTQLYLQFDNKPNTYEQTEAKLTKLIASEARKKGYTIGPIYHGTKSIQKFNEFDLKKMFSDSRIFFTMNRSLAQEYADVTGHVITAYLRIDDLDDYSSGEHTNPSKIKPVQYYGMFDPHRVRNNSKCFAVTNPEQAKFALWTYDDRGMLIPLSRRFDITTTDMRY